MLHTLRSIFLWARLRFQSRQTALSVLNYSAFHQSFVRYSAHCRRFSLQVRLGFRFSETILLRRISPLRLFRQSAFSFWLVWHIKTLSSVLITIPIHRRLKNVLLFCLKTDRSWCFSFATFSLFFARLRSRFRSISLPTLCLTLNIMRLLMLSNSLAFCLQVYLFPKSLKNSAKRLTHANSIRFAVSVQSSCIFSLRCSALKACSKSRRAHPLHSSPAL